MINDFVVLTTADLWVPLDGVDDPLVRGWIGPVLRMDDRTGAVLLRMDDRGDAVLCDIGLIGPGSIGPIRPGSIGPGSIGPSSYTGLLALDCNRLEVQDRAVRVHPELHPLVHAVGLPPGDIAALVWCSLVRLKAGATPLSAGWLDMVGRSKAGRPLPMGDGTILRFVG